MNNLLTQALNEAIDLIITLQFNNVQGNGRYIEDCRVFSVLNSLAEAKGFMEE